MDCYRILELIWEQTLSLTREILRRRRLPFYFFFSRFLVIVGIYNIIFHFEHLPSRLHGRFQQFFFRYYYDYLCVFNVNRLQYFAVVIHSDCDQVISECACLPRRVFLFLSFCSSSVDRVALYIVYCYKSSNINVCVCV